MDLTEQEIRDEVHRLAPFHHKIDLPHGLSTHVPELSRRPIEFTRLDNLVKHAFPTLMQACGGSLQGKRVLDVACNCGGFSVKAAKYSAEYVLGIDLMDHYIEQANLIKNALELEQVEFKTMSVENLDESVVGLFDVTFCFGILYHFENPILAMKRLASVTKGMMLIDTTVIPTKSYINRFIRPFIKDFINKPLWEMGFPGISKKDAKSASTSLWRAEKSVAELIPNEEAVVELLKFLGFSQVGKIAPKEGLEQRYYNGLRATFLAIR